MIVFQNGLRYHTVCKHNSILHSVACARFDYYKKEPVNCGVLPYKPPEVIMTYLGITA